MVLLHFACTLVTDDAHSRRVDLDGDGHAATIYGGEDCVDDDASFHPGATDDCDGLDQDCDGTVDEDAETRSDWYLDADGDGLGAGDPLPACEAPAGHVADATDCDDADADVHPGADEVCGADEDLNCDGVVADGGDQDGDGWAACDDCDDTDAGISPGAEERCNAQDDDCDGLVDVDAVDGATWYTDADGDGYGDDASAVVTCDPDAGAVEAGGDCDDGDDDVNPGADEDCASAEDLNCDGSTGQDDNDADGHVACEECDDGDPDVHPAATERCNDTDDDCDGSIDDSAADADTWYADADADGYGDRGATTRACDPVAGYVSDDNDCDDTDAAVHPGATEICGGGDEDCDGIEDTDAIDASTWYADADGDGFGDASDTTRACEEPAAHSADATDCDDARSAVHPGAEETCNDLDDDCSGDVDSDATDRPDWFTDADGDGYGADSSVVLACDAPAGAVAVGGDCDETSATVKPGAAETCDGTDTNCSGDESDASDADAYYEDLDGDGFGTTASLVMACDDPGVDWVRYDEDCDDGDAAISPDEAEVCNDGLDNDCDGGANSCVPAGTRSASDTADVTLKSSAARYGTSCGSTSTVYDPYTGRDLAIHKDITGDGVADLVLYRDGTDDSGGAYVLSGATLSASEDPYTDSEAVLTGEKQWYAGNYLVEDVGDLDGDGDHELAIGARGDYVESVADYDGALYLVQDAVSGTVDLTGHGWIQGDGNSFGEQSAAGGADFDGDGGADLIVGAQTDDGGGYVAGAIYLFADATTAASVADADQKWEGEDENDYAGTALSLSGDLDGDGLHDAAIGAAAAGDGDGAVYVVLGGSTPPNLGFADSKLTGGATDYLGYAIEAADFDGDGRDDLLLGAQHAGEGAVYVIADPLTTGVAATVAVATYTETEPGAYTGVRVAPLDDLDGDGIAEFVATATGWDGTSTAYYAYGAAMWFVGPHAGALSPEYVRSGYYQAGLGSDIDAGDVDADGVLDVLVSGNQVACSGGDNAYLLYGSGI